MTNCFKIRLLYLFWFKFDVVYNRSIALDEFYILSFECDTIGWIIQP